MFQELFFVGVGDGDIGFPENDAVALDDFDFVHLHDERAMYAHKAL